MIFILSALWWRRGLWKVPDGRDWLRGKLDLALVGEAVFSKSWIQFSVDGKDCVPSLLLDLRPNYCGGDEDNGDLLQKVRAHSAAFSALTLKQATADPHLHRRLLGTHGHIGVSFLWGHCSFLLDPCARFYSCLPRVCFPSPVCSGGSVVGLGDLLWEGLCHARSAIPIAPAPGHCWPVPPRRHSDTVWLSLCGLGVRFVPLPGLSNSGDRCLASMVPGGPCVFITSQVPAARLPWVCLMSPLDSWSQAMTLLANVNHPGSQEDLVSS